MAPIKTLCIALCLTGSIWTQAQIIKGRVVDAETLEALHFVAVKSGEQGTYTRADGSFELKIKKTDTDLYFSFIGYWPERYSLSEFSENQVIKLRQKRNELKEVTITATPSVSVVDNQRTVVLDYAFLDSMICILSAEGIPERFKITLLSQRLDTVDYYWSKESLRSLFTDCLNNIQVLGKDKVYQLFFNGKDIQLLYPVAYSEFHKKLEPCVASTSTKLFIETKSGQRTIEMGRFRFKSNNRYIQYQQIDRKTGQINSLPLISIDEKTLESAKNENWHQAMLEKAGTYKIPGTNKEADRIFDEKILFKEVFAPLFAIQDSVFIFNFSFQKIQSLTPALKLTTLTPITFQEQKNWKPEIFADRLEQKFYTRFETSGRASIHEISLMTGRLTHETILPYSFCENIGVNGGHIYFLYRNPVGRNLALGRIPVDRAN